MAKPSFEEVWPRILTHKGETFHTIRGLPFTYSIEEDVFCTNRTDYPLSKPNFEYAYSMVPIKGPGAINEIVRGPTYVWAVLHDERISQGE